MSCANAMSPSRPVAASCPPHALEDEGGEHQGNDQVRRRTRNSFSRAARASPFCVRIDDRPHPRGPMPDLEDREGPDVRATRPAVYRQRRLILLASLVGTILAASVAVAVFPGSAARASTIRPRTPSEPRTILERDFDSPEADLVLAARFTTSVDDAAARRHGHRAHRCRHEGARSAARRVLLDARRHPACAAPTATAGSSSSRTTRPARARRGSVTDDIEASVEESSRPTGATDVYVGGGQSVAKAINTQVARDLDPCGVDRGPGHLDPAGLRVRKPGRRRHADAGRHRGDPRQPLRAGPGDAAHRRVGVLRQPRHRPGARPGDRLRPARGEPVPRGAARADGDHGDRQSPAPWRPRAARSSSPGSRSG